MKCQYCGKEITKKSHHSGGVKKYCSNECFKMARGCHERIWRYTICQYCGKTFKEQRDTINLYCSKSCSGKAQSMIRAYLKEDEQEFSDKEFREELREELHSLMRRAEQIVYKLEHEKICKVCGQFFIAINTNQICCSPECSRRHENRNKDKRIYKNGKPDLSINLTRLYMRDQGICQICGRHIDFDCDNNSDYYPSIDHIIPIAKGGMHQWDNVQLACRMCNSLKSDTV